MSDKLVTVSLRQVKDFQFEINYGDGLPVLLADEPPPLGAGLGPTPSQLLASAVGNCLSDSLLFALRKFKQSPEPITTQVRAEVGRNPEGRIRVLAIHTDLQLGVNAAALERLDRILPQFESFCTVSQSVGVGIALHTRVLDARGALLYESGAAST